MGAVTECTHPWHRQRFAARYRVEKMAMPGSQNVGTGYSCVRCGFRSMSITDDDGNDCTDRFIVRIWIPSLRSRVLTDLRGLFDERAHRRLVNRTGCVVCGKNASGDTEVGCADGTQWWCRKCYYEILGIDFTAE